MNKASGSDFHKLTQKGVCSWGGVWWLVGHLREHEVRDRDGLHTSDGLEKLVAGADAP